jgi:acyl-CoA synthetase (AMP-forming)/AMP-acid ligase II
MPVSSEPTTLGAMLRASAARQPDAIAIRFGGESISYALLDQRIDRAAHLLQALGIKRGDRVGLMLPNCPEMLILDFACFRIGAIAVPVNTRYQRGEASYALDHSGTSLLIVDAAFLPVVDGLDTELAELRTVLVRDARSSHRQNDLRQALEQVPASVVDESADPSDAAIIFYTSGSTARPKGVIHTHATLMSVCACQTQTRRMAPGRRWLVTTGIGYVAGFSGISLPALASGATIVVEEDLSADALIRAIARERVHATLALPTRMLDILESPLAAQSDLSTLEQVYIGGDECSHDLYHRFRQRFGYDLAQLLGMTECEGYLTNQPGPENRIGSVGRPADCIEVRLIDADGRVVEDERAGELQLKAPSMMIGYWNNPEATAETLSNGWLSTGDVARRDAEGYYWFIERKREIVIRDGSNIAPHEVEDVIDSHPAVAESCVVGVPDPHHGAILKAFIELEVDAGPVTGNALTAWLESRLSRYKIPELWAFMPSLPRTATGKIDRHRLHRLAQE